MKIGIAVNHSWPHIGGCEIVVQKIGESLHKHYDDEVIIFSRSAQRKNFTHNGIKIEGTNNTFKGFCDQINHHKLDHLMIYSDLFVYAPRIVQFPSLIKCDKSIALVGMNYFVHKIHDLKKKKNDFKFIVHSGIYQDYKRLSDLGIQANIIPNFVDLLEFEKKPDYFRNKYGIMKGKKAILCVSNFFPEKNQTKLLDVYDALYKHYKNFMPVFISSKTNSHQAEILSRKYKKTLLQKPYPSVFLRDIPREDVVQAYFECDLFAFPSIIEVSPLVLLECMAASLPYVSLDVGNANELAGGIIINTDKRPNGRAFFDGRVLNGFIKALWSLLQDENLYEKKSFVGRDLILSKYNLKNITKMYRNVFSRGNSGRIEGI